MQTIEDIALQTDIARRSERQVARIVAFVMIAYVVLGFLIAMFV